MRKEKIMLQMQLFFAGTFIFAGSFSSGIEGNPQEQEQIIALLSAVYQAQKPVHDIRVSWYYETVSPLGMVDEHAPGNNVPHTTREYTATISGIRLRLEYLQKTYETIDSKEPYDIRHETYVFDGTKSRRLTDRIKGVRTTPLGSQSFKNPCAIILQKELYACDLPLDDLEKLKEYQLKFIDTENPDMYVVDAISPNKEHCRLTIDANRGYNIVKTEWFNSYNKVSVEDIIMLKEYTEGFWFPVERKRVRYYKDGTKKEESNSRFSKVELNIEMPEGTYSLEYPHGAKVWDSVLENWITVGEDEFERYIKVEDIITEPKQLKIENKDISVTPKEEPKQNKVIETLSTETPGYRSSFFHLIIVVLGLILFISIICFIKTRKK